MASSLQAVSDSLCQVCRKKKKEDTICNHSVCKQCLTSYFFPPIMHCPICREQQELVHENYAARQRIKTANLTEDSFRVTYNAPSNTIQRPSRQFSGDSTYSSSSYNSFNVLNNSGESYYNCNDDNPLLIDHAKETITRLSYKDALSSNSQNQIGHRSQISERELHEIFNVHSCSHTSIDYYCSTCTTFSCSECKQYHKNYSFHKTNEDTLRNILLGNCNKILLKCEELENSLTKKDSVKNLQSRYIFIKEQIGQSVMNVKEELKRRKIQLLKDLDMHHNVKSRILTTRLNYLTERNMILRDKQYLIKMALESNDVELLVKTHFVMKRI